MCILSGKIWALSAGSSASTTESSVVLEDSTVQIYTEVAECFLQCCQYHRAQHITNMHMLSIHLWCYRKYGVVRNWSKWEMHHKILLTERIMKPGYPSKHNTSLILTSTSIYTLLHKHLKLFLFLKNWHWLNPLFHNTTNISMKNPCII